MKNIKVEVVQKDKKKSKQMYYFLKKKKAFPHCTSSLLYSFLIW